MERLTADDEYVVSVDIGCQPSPSGSAETIIQMERTTLVVFHAISSKLSADGCYDNLDFTLVECVGCCRTLFGYPNDEGLPEHPLYDKGLSEIPEVAEVINSSWAAALGDQMDASTWRIRGQYDKAFQMPQGGKRLRDWRHFIFQFKENTFECIADELRVISVGKPYEKIMDEVSRRISGG